MENDLERLIVEREELEDRCMKLIDENKTLQNLRDRLAATESDVNAVVNNYDFDEIVDDNLSDKVAQVIGDGEFIFRR